ncbi:unnamed protein product, partial [Brenthis ino]
MYKWLVFIVILKTVSAEEDRVCEIKCPVEDKEMVCAFDIIKRAYKIFPSKCAMDEFAKCFNNDLVKTPLKFCLKEYTSTRRIYGESCPVFCPSHYKPVCGASKYRDYIYRTFNNGCYLDMINCRGDDDTTGYVEVPLQFCQRHLMKNIFKEKLVMSDTNDFQDYK